MLTAWLLPILSNSRAPVNRQQERISLVGKVNLASTGTRDLPSARTLDSWEVSGNRPSTGTQELPFRACAIALSTGKRHASAHVCPRLPTPAAAAEATGTMRDPAAGLRGATRSRAYSSESGSVDWTRPQRSRRPPAHLALARVLVDDQKSCQ
jgi:hypothetical protein